MSGLDRDEQQRAVYAVWNDWLETIKNDVTNLSVNRHIFREVQKIVETNPTIHLTSDFYEWMGTGYIWRP